MVTETESLNKNPGQPRTPHMAAGGELAFALGLKD